MCRKKSRPAAARRAVSQLQRKLPRWAAIAISNSSASMIVSTRVVFDGSAGSSEPNSIAAS